MSKLSQYREQIDRDMDRLQSMMESNTHLETPATVLEHIETISYKWGFLSEEDRDYVQAAQIAIDEGIEWNV